MTKTLPKTYTKESLIKAINSIVNLEAVETMDIVKALNEAAIILFLMPSLSQTTTNTIKDALTDIRQEGQFCYSEQDKG